MVLVSYFIDRIETVKRELPLAPSAYQSFFLTISVTTNELFVLYLKPISLTCAEVIPSLLSRDWLLRGYFSISVIQLASLLHHYCCKSSHHKNKNLSRPHFPLHPHSYFFGPLMAKPYSQTVTIHRP